MKVMSFLDSTMSSDMSSGSLLPVTVRGTSHSSDSSSGIECSASIDFRVSNGIKAEDARRQSNEAFDNLEAILVAKLAACGAQMENLLDENQRLKQELASIKKELSLMKQELTLMKQESIKRTGRTEGSECNAGQNKKLRLSVKRKIEEEACASGDCMGKSVLKTTEIVEKLEREIKKLKQDNKKLQQENQFLSKSNHELKLCLEKFQ